MRFLRGTVEQNRIRIKVGIRAFNPALSPLEAPSQHFEEFTALVDTGALRTCVTQDVVDRLGLKRRGRIEVGNVKGRDWHWTYLFHVAIWPDSDDHSISAAFGIGDEVEGIDVGDSRYYDVLLGMDILRRGALKLDLDGSFKLSFPG
ncbi:retroviral-like aspartic protease family protein [Erythrobacteraceae bacterium E2-1 Yellow Sea]|nr:retroviral-like aspartic protease family protein [Erythrobacteraceae bacterium E2-1 Yellow Sea]